MQLKTSIILGHAKTEAPAAVIPGEGINPESLQSDIIVARNKIEALAALTPRHYFNHPYFGDLDRDAAIKFLALHTRHHLKIVDDIVNAS